MSRRNNSSKIRHTLSHAYWMAGEPLGCHWCPKELPPSSLTVDHIIPRWSGGRHSPSNTVLASRRLQHGARRVAPLLRGVERLATRDPQRGAEGAAVVTANFSVRRYLRLGVDDLMMHMTYSPQGDALAIRLSRGRGHVRTMEVRPGVHLDFDSEDRCVGLELLDASFHCDQAELEQLDRPTGEPERRL